jgi:hypothetical protein
MELLQTIGASVLGGGVVSFLFKEWLSFQLERFKGEQAQKLEPVKSQLALLVRLQAGVHEKRAEIAARVLVACLDFLDMLAYITSPMHIGESDDQSPADSFAAVIDQRWKEGNPSQIEFNKCRALADTYLPAEAAELMTRIWELRAEIWANQSTHFAMVGQGPGGREFWRNGFGSVPASKAAALKDDAKALLRPIVQQEGGLSTAAEASSSVRAA